MRKKTFLPIARLIKVILFVLCIMFSCVCSLYAGELYFREQDDIVVEIPREQSIKKLLDRFEGKVEEKILLSMIEKKSYLKKLSIH